MTITYDHEARKRSYELIAEAVGLEPREPADAVSSLTANVSPTLSSQRSFPSAQFPDAVGGSGWPKAVRCTGSAPSGRTRLSTRSV